MGWHCSDTAELSFVDVHVYRSTNLVGQENGGFALIMRQFQVERVTMAVEAYATAQRCLDLTVEWTRLRKTFGEPLISRQVVSHKLAEMAQRIDLARTYTREMAAGSPRARTASPRSASPRTRRWTRARSWSTRRSSCTAASGTCGTSEVERHYRDARILGIGGGASEVMTELAARRLGYTE